MPRPEKVATVEEIRTKLESARAAVLTEYRGLKVAELADLRAALRAADAEYKIFKNTLARRAAEEAGLAELTPLLDGPTAITFVRGDAVLVAKALRDYARSNPALVLKGGILGTRVIRSDDVVALADIQPREVLLARIAGGLQAPLTKAAGIFQAFTRNMAYGLKALIDQRVAAGESLETPATPAEPAPVEAAAPEPALAEPAAEAPPEPAPPPPALAEPAAPAPGLAEPAAPEPALAEPAAPAPGLAEPAASESPAPEPAGPGPVPAPATSDVAQEPPTAAAVDGPPPVDEAAVSGGPPAAEIPLPVDDRVGSQVTAESAGSPGSPPEGAPSAAEAPAGEPEAPPAPPDVPPGGLEEAVPPEPEPPGDPEQSHP